MPKGEHLTSSFQSFAASTPRVRRPKSQKSSTPTALIEPPPPPTRATYDNKPYLESRTDRETWLAEKAKVDTETKRVEHALLIGKLIKVDDAQQVLEEEHQNWLTAIEDWRQSINKKLSKLGIPVEMQELISDMISKEIVAMRQRRVAMDIKHVR